jgi:hypothetical protein
MNQPYKKPCAEEQMKVITEKDTVMKFNRILMLF